MTTEREALEALIDCVQREVITHDGDVADRFSEGAMQRLRDGVKQAYKCLDGDSLETRRSAPHFGEVRVPVSRSLKEDLFSLLSTHFLSAGLAVDSARAITSDTITFHVYGSTRGRYASVDVDDDGDIIIGVTDGKEASIVKENTILQITEALLSYLGDPRSASKDGELSSSPSNE